jgi:hypothetical protein
MWGAMILFIFFNTQTMHNKSKTHSSIAMFSLKTLYPGGIRTRVCCLRGFCDAHCTTPPGHDEGRSLLSLFLYNLSVRPVTEIESWFGQLQLESTYSDKNMKDSDWSNLATKNIRIHPFSLLRRGNGPLNISETNKKLFESLSALAAVIVWFSWWPEHRSHNYIDCFLTCLSALAERTKVLFCL